MRNVVLILVIAILFCACDPTISKFEVTPDTVNCSGTVTLKWTANGDAVHLKADQPVSPAIPDEGIQNLPKQGTRDETVTQTTEFTLYYPGAGHREKTVTVTHNNCGGPVPGSCGPSALTFNGTCFDAAQGPQYNTQLLAIANAPGNITAMSNDANFPVHVQHAGFDIALGAGGGPIFPLPSNIPAAGSYTIIVPGAVGQNICAGAGPTMGSFPAPPVTIHVTPTCP